MREYLFRGKREDNEEWVYGGWFKVDNENYIITNCDNIPIFDLWNFAEYVIPETVGQYTGLTDKNGKKIFEGDIVKVVTLNDDTEKPFIEEMFEIFFDEKGRAYKMRCYIGDKISEDPFDFSKAEVEKYQVEIIGNIYDNPELLEVYYENTKNTL